MMVYVRLCLFLYIQLNGVFLLSFAEFHLKNTTEMTDMTDMAYTTLWYPVPLIYTHPNQICMSISCSIRRVSTGQPHKTRFPSGDHRAETTKWLVPCKVHDVSGWARNIMVPGPQWSPMVPWYTVYVQNINNGTMLVSGFCFDQFLRSWTLWKLHLTDSSITLRPSSFWGSNWQVLNYASQTSWWLSPSQTCSAQKRVNHR
jgi:hypothetical protein